MEIRRWHGIPLSIISKRGAYFTSHFWRSFKKSLGTKAKLTTAFHPQTDGQAESDIHTIEDMLRACVIYFRGSWDEFLSMIAFSYNNSNHSSIGMESFEALYGRRCKYPVGWFEVRDSSILGPEIIHEALEKVRVIRNRLATGYSCQNSYPDNRKRPLEFDVCDSVYLKVSPMKGVMRFGRKGNLSPSYVGPYGILQRVGEETYELALPVKLASVHPDIDVSMLKKCLGGPVLILPMEGLGIDEDLSCEEVRVEILYRQVKWLRNNEIATVKVFWRNHLVEGAMWEVEADIISIYPHLFSS